ncbi:hypothetical protein AJ80_01260 [Polytolypa hystricis UAMH7299]|uniref:Uncharacterized protein n=1 Tax=Polytolypa hystricis (strain UAMH7299) TaxID=1447883 RepID=A0A2B7YSR1_POLH7|nr:hypothetical protein AJ80_01260 [Polytolypa hystricis UAMH7299]
MPRTRGWIWPKDPRPGNFAKWKRGSRLRDILTNKGPDIFVGTLDGHIPVPRRPRWSRWQDVLGYDGDGSEEKRESMPWARRRNQRYNFRTRRYEEPNMRMWSDVEYFDADPLGGYLKVPYAVRDWQGLEGTWFEWQHHYGAWP